MSFNINRMSLVYGDTGDEKRVDSLESILESSQHSTTRGGGTVAK